jgi:hypothetical protein
MAGSNDWKGPIRDSVPNLTDFEKYQLITKLKPFADMWEGKLGCISTFKHHIITSGPPIASKMYRAGPQSRTLIEAEADTVVVIEAVVDLGTLFSTVLLLSENCNQLC